MCQHQLPASLYSQTAMSSLFVDSGTTATSASDQILVFYVLTLKKPHPLVLLVPFEKALSPSSICPLVPFEKALSSSSI